MLLGTHLLRQRAPHAQECQNNRSCRQWLMQAPFPELLSHEYTVVPDCLSGGRQ